MMLMGVIRMAAGAHCISTAYFIRIQMHTGLFREPGGHAADLD